MLGFPVYVTLIIQTIIIMSEFNIGDIINNGHNAVIHKAVEIKSGQMFALKIISKQSKLKERRARNEIDVLAHLSHRSIIKMISAFESDQEVFIQLEYLDGGDLLSNIASRGNFTQESARSLIFDLIDGISYLHRHNFIHRNLAPECLVISTSHRGCHLKIGGFALADYIPDNHQLSSIRGQIHYMAPEVISEDYYYGRPVDMWAVGVISYLMLCGCVPFDGEDSPECMKAIVYGELAFDSELWELVSDDVHDFLKALINRDVKLRLTADNAMKHTFMAGEVAVRGVNVVQSTSQSLLGPVTKNLKLYEKSRAKFSNVSEAIKAFKKNLLPSKKPPKMALNLAALPPFTGTFSSPGTPNQEIPEPSLLSPPIMSSHSSKSNSSASSKVGSHNGSANDLSKSSPRSELKGFSFFNIFRSNGDVERKAAAITKHRERQLEASFSSSTGSERSHNPTSSVSSDYSQDYA
eukprot:Partr_v1_DN26915_c0_g1_i3_m7085 putative doublecortin-like kinase